MIDDTKKIYYLCLPGEWPWLNKIIAEAKKPTKTPKGWLKASETGMPVTGIAYAKLKSDTEKSMKPFVDYWLGAHQIHGNCFFYIRIYAKNKRKDPNNLKVLDKFVCDLIQTLGICPNDGWGNMSEGYFYKFFIDKKKPRVEIWIHENYEIDMEIDEGNIVNLKT